MTRPARRWLPHPDPTTARARGRTPHPASPASSTPGRSMPATARSSAPATATWPPSATTPAHRNTSLPATSTPTPTTGGSITSGPPPDAPTPSASAARSTASTPPPGKSSSTTPTSALPDGVIYKACGNRRTSACPSCAETYRRDAFQLLRAGPDRRQRRPRTCLRSPGRVRHLHRPLLRPRPHPARPAAHLRQQSRLHLQTGALPRPPRHRNLSARPQAGLLHPPPPRRPPARAADLPGLLRLRRRRGVEQQHRRTVAAHQTSHRTPPQPARPPPPPRPTASASPTAKPPNTRPAARSTSTSCSASTAWTTTDPGRLLPPPPGLTVADLEDATRHAAATISYLTPPHPALPQGGSSGGAPSWTCASSPCAAPAPSPTYGRQLPRQILHQRHRGHRPHLPSPHPGHRRAARRRHRQPHRTADPCLLGLGAHPEYRSLQRWAHMLGFGGHFLTKGRHYSVPFRALRAARITYRRTQDPGPEHGPSAPPTTRPRKPPSSSATSPTPEPAGKPPETPSSPTPPPTKPENDTKQETKNSPTNTTAPPAAAVPHKSSRHVLTLKRQVGRG